MKLAQKQHSEAEMEKNRIAFYKRFEKIEADKKQTVVEPISEIACKNYQAAKCRGRIKISCRYYSNQPYC